jgi:hypothetical protein
LKVSPTSSEDSSSVDSVATFFFIEQDVRQKSVATSDMMNWMTDAGLTLQGFDRRWQWLSEKNFYCCIECRFLVARLHL